VTITGARAKAARKLLGWSRAKLSTESGVGVATIVIFENGLQPQKAATLGALKRALETAGLVFTDVGELRLKLRKSK
jgi:transcriptional regulator with XRE-family HTH domain